MLAITKPIITTIAITKPDITRDLPRSLAAAFRLREG
jgi:hypothetical protein